jgi:hypothetical protein
MRMSLSSRRDSGTLPFATKGARRSPKRLSLCETMMSSEEAWRKGGKRTAERCRPRSKQPEVLT